MNFGGPTPFFVCFCFLHGFQTSIPDPHAAIICEWLAVSVAYHCMNDFMLVAAGAGTRVLRVLHPTVNCWVPHLQFSHLINVQCIHMCECTLTEKVPSPCLQRCKKLHNCLCTSLCILSIYLFVCLGLGFKKRHFPLFILYKSLILIAKVNMGKYSSILHGFKYFYASAGTLVF